MEPKVMHILSEAIEVAGGIEPYQNLAKLKFLKTTSLFDSTGTLASLSEEQHRYHFKPEKVLEMIWQDEKGQHQLVLAGDKITKYRNGKSDADFDPEQSKQNLLAAEYVVTLPFRLLDQNMHLQYEGIVSLNDQSEVHVIRAQYQSVDQSDLSMHDVWWHYFNTESFIYEGYKVKHTDHYSLVINVKFQQIDEFLLPVERTSYRVDASGKQLFVRADYKYQDYHLRKALKKVE
jgi:hypothetical protein